METSNVTLTTVFVDAVTSKLELPILPVHGLSTNSLHASSNGTYNGEKIHHFGNSTGIMTADRLSVCYGPSVRPSNETLFVIVLVFILVFVSVFFLFHPVYFHNVVHVGLNVDVANFLGLKEINLALNVLLVVALIVVLVTLIKTRIQLIGRIGKCGTLLC